MPDVTRTRIPATPRHVARLHRLERPVPFSLALTEALNAAASEDTGRLYPDYAAFTSLLAAHVGRTEDIGRVMPSDLCLGAGIEDFIRTLMLICCEPGDEVAYPWPTCAMFDVYAEHVFKLKPVRIRTEPFKRLTVDEVMAQLSPRTRLLILPNPGQPVETYFSPASLRKLAERCASLCCVLAVDEAYAGFGGQSFIRDSVEMDNVVVLRTFSKAYGLAGARVAYAMGTQALVAALRGIRLSGEVAGPSMAMAATLMDWWPTVSKGISEVAGMRDWTKLKIIERGYRVEGERANHLLIEIPYPGGPSKSASRVAERLLKRGWAVRSGMPTPVDHHIMVTCGDRATMRDFVLDFEECLF